MILKILILKKAMLWRKNGSESPLIFRPVCVPRFTNSIIPRRFSNVYSHIYRTVFLILEIISHRSRFILFHFSFQLLGEVERLLKDYQQNQDFIRNLGNRFYQIIYPIQVRQRERFGVSTREIQGSYGKVCRTGNLLETK